MRKIQPNKIRNTPKKVSNMRINNTPKIVIENPSIVVKLKQLLNQKQELKNRVIKQLKKHFKKLSDAKKKWVFR